MTTNTASNKDENLMAAIAHAGIILGGIWIALIIWLIQKDKSKYVNFQAKQALVYQLVSGVLLMALWIVAILLAFVLIGFLLIPLVMLLGLCVVIYGIYAAYKTYKGEDFKYYIIGNMLSK